MTHARRFRPFETVLVANRGEIALRVIRSLRRLGLGVAAVYSEADRDSPHVRAADRAICIGGAAPRESYLDVSAVIAAARLTGADAIHPGYGFLAEDDRFAAAVEAAGMVFIGPPAEAIRAMGNKAHAKRLLAASELPCIPGYQGDDQADAAFIAAARDIGYPVMVKAAAGGGGRGMRLVHGADGLPAALASARSEALQAFGNGELILERALVAPRHVEIQLLADSHGHCIHLGERDCSVQRRHQKLIEESPSPAVDAALRARMGEAAVSAARAIGYVGAGTMEFLLDRDGRFYFMEMNTRLQVEHAVTEAVSGIDLVEWQLRIAAGEALALLQSEVALSGHAIEVRLTAEDVAAGFLPQTGSVLRWRPPDPQTFDVRVDHALVEGGTVSPHYDSMVAKLVAHGATRDEARRKLLAALQHCVLLGLPSNQAFLCECLRDPVFRAGSEVHTGFVGERFNSALAHPLAPGSRTLAFAGLAVLAQHLPADGRGGSWGESIGIVALRCAGAAWQLRATMHAGGWQVAIARQDDAAAPVTLSLRHARCESADGATWSAEIDAVRECVTCAVTEDAVHLFHAGRAWIFDRIGAHRSRAGPHAADSITAPLTARVLELLVAVGDHVQPGQPLVVLEAMKMEHTLTAVSTARVAEVRTAAGSQAGKGDLLLRLEALP